MQWYYSRSGRQLGPVEEGELLAKLASGEVSPADLVWRDGMADWQPAGKVTELAPSTAFPAVPPPAFGAAVSSPYAPPNSAAMVPGAVIPNYLWQSIVVTIFCCWPFGIPAIVYAAKVDGLKARGDISGAMAASASAKTWCVVAAGVWIGLMVLAGIAALFSSGSHYR